MVKQRRYLACLLFVSLVSISSPSTTEAGPLLDWLFQRNRSQGLAGNSGSLFGNSCLSRRSGYGNVGGFGSGTGAPGYGANQNPAANAYAGQPNATTAGYAPQGGCSSGWCQQTVVKYVPQTAYRTAYQPVPVTTYKTSTTINPANGLPLTCTRPCTSYSYQARRVPYTTYRPVYTTVPVADTWGQQQQQSPNTAGYAPAPQMPSYNQTYAYQPQTSPTPGCASCQNQNTMGNYGGGYGGGYSNWSSVPGYTPGNATNLPPYAGGPASAGTPWSNTPLAAPQSGASPWRDVQPRSGGYESAPGATAWENYDESPRDGYGVTPWQNEPASRGFQGGNTPADDRPRLNNRPEYSEDFGQSTFRPLTPKPMSEEMRRRIMGPSNSDAPAESSYRDNDGFQRNYAAARTGQPDLFRTPTEQGYGPSNSSINPPTNQDYDRAEENNREYFRGGIRDYDRTQPNNWTDINDKTAEREGGSMPLIEEDEGTRTRYAAAPIQWQDEKRTDRRERNPNWRNDSFRSRSGARRQSEWTPVR